MPSFAKAVPHLLLVSALTTWPITTAANTNSYPVFLSDGGHSKNHRRVGKNSKKQNVQQCTPDDFVGEFIYSNCRKKETKVKIICDNGINQCDYKEKPMDDDSGDDGCLIHGTFDSTDISRNPATGVCQLNFIPLKNSCNADALSPGLFGMKAEVNKTIGHDDTSSRMLLWFSIDGGLTFYNKNTARETVVVNPKLPSRRKLDDRDAAGKICPGSKCSEALFGHDFCNNFCNSDLWQGCGLHHFSYYECSCTGCNECLKSNPFENNSYEMCRQESNSDDHFSTDAPYYCYTHKDSDSGQLKGRVEVKACPIVKNWPNEYKACYQDGGDIYCWSYSSKSAYSYSLKFGPFNKCPLDNDDDCEKCPPSLYQEQQERMLLGNDEAETEAEAGMSIGKD